MNSLERCTDYSNHHYLVFSQKVEFLINTDNIYNHLVSVQVTALCKWHELAMNKAYTERVHYFCEHNSGTQDIYDYI